MVDLTVLHWVEMLVVETAALLAVEMVVQKVDLLAELKVVWTVDLLVVCLVDYLVDKTAARMVVN
jgi:hypothetical protein